MLKNIDPALTPDLLYVLASMGHGDEIAIVDTNFPTSSVAGDATIIQMPLVSSARAVKAILSLMPLDSFVDVPCHRMEVVGAPDKLESVQLEVQAELDAAQPSGTTLGSLERFAFYTRAKEAFAVVRTGERRFYGCFLLKKGVIPPP